MKREEGGERKKEGTSPRRTGPDQNEKWRPRESPCSVGVGRGPWPEPQQDEVADHRSERCSGAARECEGPPRDPPEDGNRTACLRFERSVTKKRQRVVATPPV